MSVETNALSGEQVVDENPDILKEVEPNSEIKEWLVTYVGNKYKPEDNKVTIDMVLETMAKEFPEFLLPIAEENFIRGYRQALQDAEEGREAYEEAQKELDTPVELEEKQETTKEDV